METRTKEQNDALHLYFEQLAKECREKGITLKAIIKEITKGGVYPTERSLKVFFQGVCDVMFSKNRTSKLTKEEFSDAVEQFVVVMAKVGAETPFPNKEDLEFNKHYENSH